MRSLFSRNSRARGKSTVARENSSARQSLQSTVTKEGSPAYDMATKRINKELMDFATAPPVDGAEMTRIDGENLRCILRLPLLGAVLEVQVQFPPDYPFHPPVFKLAGTSSGGPQRIFAEKLRAVCPELTCWRRTPFPDLLELRLDGEGYYDLKWSPALTVKTLVPVLAARMGAPSLVEAAESMIIAAPEAKDGAEGTVMVLVGSAGEEPPYPPAAAHGGAFLGVLIDPCWVCPRVLPRQGFSASAGHEPAWWSPQSGVHYVALAAPYCYDDPATVQALRRLLAGLREKGWSRVYFDASGISVPFPSDIEGLCPRLADWRVRPDWTKADERTRARATCWAGEDGVPLVRSTWGGAPSWLRRQSVGETAGNYGGLNADNGNGDKTCRQGPVHETISRGEE